MAKEPVQVQTPDANDVKENKGISFLSYIGILVLVPLLTKKESPFAQFHAKQGLGLFVFGVVISLIMAIPFLGWVVGVVGYIMYLVFMIMGLVNVGKGVMKPLPVVGGWFAKMK